MNIGLIEQLTHSTVRIETNLRGGGISTGTGFYMELLQKGDNVVPAIVTNKHVIANAQVGKIHVTLATADGMPDMGNHYQFQFNNFEQQSARSASMEFKALGLLLLSPVFLIEFIIANVLIPVHPLRKY